MNEATVSLYIDATAPMFDDTLTLVGEKLRSVGAEGIDIDYEDQHVNGRRLRTWSVGATFVDGHTTTGTCTPSDSPRDTTLILRACADLLRKLGWHTLAARVDGAVGGDTG